MPKENIPYQFDLGVKIFNCSIDEYYEFFLKKDGPMSMKSYFNVKKYKDIVIEDVKVEDDPKN